MAKQLNKSWFAHICNTSGITIKHDVIIEKYVAEFQKKAIEALEKEVKDGNHYQEELDGIDIAIQIIKNLKA